MSDYQGNDRTAVRHALANLSPSGVGNGWLGVFDPSELPRPPNVTGDPQHPRCWLTYQLMQWTPSGTFKMDPTDGPMRSFEVHLIAWVEPVGGVDLRDMILSAAVDALTTFSATAPNNLFQTQAARHVSIDEILDGYLYGVVIVPSYGGVEQ